MQSAAFSDEETVLVSIARDLVVRKPGERIPTVAEYQDRFGVGSETIQSRLRALAAVGAIRVQARGHRGTVLVSRSLPSLWSLARMAPVTGILPLPEALEPVSLAAALRRAFQHLEIPLELLYLHGSARRIDLVGRNEADFTIVSRPAAEARRAEISTWLCNDLGPQSYHRADSIVVLLGRGSAHGGPVRRVGIDPTSHDHSLLTTLEFPAAQGYVHEPMPHTRLPAAVAGGQIDAAIWLQTSLAIPLSIVGIVSRSLQRAEAIAANGALAHAVLIAPQEQEAVAAVLREVDLSGLPGIQDEILRSDVLPLY